VKYQEMMRFMSKARDISKGRPTGQRGTRLVLNARYNDACPTIVQLVYHKTPLITWHPSGRVIFSNHGWNTRTTIARMNEYLSHYNCRIFTRKGVKYIRDNTHDFEHALGTTFRIFFNNGELYNVTGY